MVDPSLSASRMAWRHVRRGGWSWRKAVTLADNLGRGLLLRSPVAGRRPSILVVENYSACNLACPGCGFQMSVRDGEVARGGMSFPRFAAIVDECAEDLLALFFYLGGEPFLHPEAAEMIRYAAERAVPVVASTNGSYRIPELGERLVAAGLDTLIVSISGTTQSVYERYHAGGRLDRVLATVRGVVAARDRAAGSGLYVVLRFIVFDYNRHQIPEAKRLAEELGVDCIDVRDDEAVVWRDASAGPRRRTARGRRRVPQDPPIQNYCWWPWTVMSIRADRVALPCCYDYETLPAMGNVEAGVAATWNGRAYRGLRAALVAQRASLPACGDCREGTLSPVRAILKAL